MKSTLGQGRQIHANRFIIIGRLCLLLMLSDTVYSPDVTWWLWGRLCA